MTTCNHCGFLVPSGATFCPECGAAVQANTSAGNPQITNADPANPNRQPTSATITTAPPTAAITGSTTPPTAAASFEAIQQSPFFHFFGRFINMMEQSSFLQKPLLWLYMLFAVLNILVPVYFLFLLINTNMLNTVGFGALVVWLVFAFAGWMGFQLWWNRKDKIGKYYAQGDNFYAIPLFSHYIQTVGEWLGMTVAIVGAGGSLAIWLFLKDNGTGGLPFPVPLKGMGIAGLIAAPILGFTIIMFTKVLAELYRALAAIANNTKQFSLKR